MFLLALEWGGNTYRWDSATVIGLFCGAAGTIALFFIWESRIGDEAMIPLSMITRRIIASSCLAMLFTAACMITTSYYMAIYFQADKGVSPMLSGVYLLPSILTQMLFGVAAGGLGNFIVGELRRTLNTNDDQSVVWGIIYHSSLLVQ
jgi:hypothetical protein